MLLATQQRLAHSDEVAAQKVAFPHLVACLWSLVLVHCLQTSYKSGIYPPVSTTPIALFAIGFAVRWHEILVAPPQAFLLVEEPTGQRVARPTIHFHGMFHVSVICRDGCHLRIDGHCHLNGINPRPPTDLCAHLVLQVKLCGKQFFFASHLLVAHQIGLRTALVVSIARLNAIARSPLMEVSPAIHIVCIALLRVHFVESHQSFVVNRTRPKRTGALFLHKCG